jgi:purine-binding chemotaxis protein CheW
MTAMDDSRAGSTGTGDEAGGQFATFFVDDLLFGVEVLRVQEVLRYQEMTSVPRAPEVIEGLINLRGQIVTAIDMRRRLGLAPRAGDRSPMNMVVRSDDGAVSLLVDEIGDVLEVEEGAFEEAPENVDAGIRELTTGMYKLKDRLLLVLDTRKAIDVSAAAGGPDRA